MHYINPFKQHGQWYRGNTHTHSSVSDGELSIPELFKGYREEGYDFLVLTDHEVVSDVSEYSDDSFLAISGSELHSFNPYGGKEYHIVAIDIQNQIDTSGLHPNTVLAAIAGQGGVSVLAHPYWSGHTLLDLLSLHGYFAVEVSNTSCGEIGRSTSETHWDDLLDRAGAVLGIACDDAHSLDDVYEGWIMVKCANLSLESIMDALRTGSFYSTQGPEIFDFGVIESYTHGSVNENNSKRRVYAKFSPSASVAFKASVSMGEYISSTKDETIAEATYTLSGSEKYVRLEITAPDGKKAWSQPIIFRST